ncbi:hypothetical protein PHACT_00185 [Pseudohongiella acticola]|uniref:DUF306 domain-containing protein n=2 Tax=Pseudohongiella acticola TaxID=1524254 RepID=A0A1E8CN23_9GAMM|nr:hypothetical protein PHACT_00185 [Pseudohongiella acticola]
MLAGCALDNANNPTDNTVGAQRFSADLQCGVLPISVRGQGEVVQLTVRGEQIDMQQRISASGARYVADTEAENSLWFKGEQASLTLEGMSYPECIPPGAIVEPFRASGNEPFWLLTLERGLLQLNQLSNKIVNQPANQAGEVAQSAQPYTFERDNGALRSQAITGQISDQVCRDSMTGMPHPKQVTLQVDGSTLTGCGGNPARLIQGAEWVLEDINGRGIIDSSRVTLNFWPDGRVTGRATCNNLMGQYQLSGEGFSINQIATTRIACAPALMAQEQTVMENLRDLQRFDVTELGALVLHSANGTLTARLEY